jgi:hypothetical protein
MAELTRAAARAIPRNYRPKLRRAVQPLLHRGNAVACPCCGKQFSGFVRHRDRPHAKCPSCASLERHRLLQLYVTERTDLPEGRYSVLHMAPEVELQRYLRSRPGLTYRSADIDSPLADDQADIQALPHADESFDVVICLHVLEHIPDDRLAEAGFDVRLDRFIDELPPERVTRHGLRRDQKLFGREDVYLCTKPAAAS